MRSISILALTCVAVLAGCANSVGLDASIKRSGFDNSAVVDMPVHGTRCGSLTKKCLGIGAQWTSASPDRVILTPSIYMEYAGIVGAKLSIDDKIVDLGQPIGVTDMSKPGASALLMSTGSFATSYETVRQMAYARKVWIRLTTPTGTVEDSLIDGDSDSKAIYAMRRFVESVELQRH